VPHMVQGLFDWMPAAAQAAIDDVIHMPRASGFVARPKVPRRFGPAPPRAVVVEAVEDGHRGPALLVADEDGEEPPLLDERDPGVRELAMLAAECEP
jgi:hypothetical protein